MGHVVGIVQLLSAATAAPADIRPVGPWSVEYADRMCLLSRGFGGTAEKPDVMLALRPLPLSARAEMVVVLPSDTAAQPRRGKVKLRLLPSGEQQQLPFLRSRSGASGRTLTSIDVPITFLDALRGSEAIEVAIGNQTPVRLATGNAAKALAALVPCQDDLVKTWGYDPALEDRIGTPAALVGGSIGTFFSREYYPPEAVRLGQEGRTTVAWTIDADGKTRDCRILDSSGYKALDLTTCVVFLQKVRYKPALDKAGKPMVSYQTMAVRWSLE